jgi:hypothetical protein
MSKANGDIAVVISFDESLQTLNQIEIDRLLRAWQRGRERGIPAHQRLRTIEKLLAAINVEHLMGGR